MNHGKKHFLTVKLRGSNSCLVVVSRQTLKSNFSHLGARGCGLILVLLKLPINLNFKKIVNIVVLKTFYLWIIYTPCKHPQNPRINVIFLIGLLIAFCCMIFSNLLNMIGFKQTHCSDWYRLKSQNKCWFFPQKLLYLIFKIWK